MLTVNKYCVLLLWVGFITITFNGFCQKVQWYSTVDSVNWKQQPAVKLQPITNDAANTALKIDVAVKDQTITGWGGCFNELGWKALQALSNKDRNEVMKALFHPKKGSKFNICRTPMGASDFALDAYSYDDVDGDYAMQHFSIERDKTTLIPFIKAAMQYRSDLTVFASPWSPPAWMKTNKHYAGGSLRFDPEILKAYALYQTKYVQEYQKAGVPLTAIHPQNEPIIKSKYPTCLWLNADTMRDFIKLYLGPQFKANQIKAQIWLGTITNADTNWYKQILDDEAAAAYISGIGIQYNGLKALPFLRKKYQLPIMQTETKCFHGKNNLKEAIETFGLMCAYLKGGCEAYMYWNMVLDETGKSSWDWSQNSSVVVDTKNKTYRFTPQFYVMKHFSAFVQPGAQRLVLANENESTVSFLNPDGSIVVVTGNKDNTPATFNFAYQGKTASVNLPPKSFHTFMIRP